jgi:hypothetical protein
MDLDLANIIRIGLADGLVWFPFVLGVGLLYTYFKEIDISVDGIAVLSGIGCAFIWRLSGSYLLPFRPYFESPASWPVLSSLWRRIPCR